MSAIVVIQIEGVLCDIDQIPPTASVRLSGLRLAAVLASSWPVGFVSSAPREMSLAWLREVRAPTAAWVAEADGLERASVILRHLAERQDRCQFYIAGDSDGTTDLSDVGIATLLAIPIGGGFTAGDWVQDSTWVDSGPPEE